MEKNVKLPVEAVKTINDILSSGKDVLLKYRENKDEIDIIEQKITVSNKFPIAK